MLNLYANDELRDALLTGIFEEETRTMNRLLEMRRKIKQELKEIDERILSSEMTRTGILNALYRKDKVTA